MYCPESLSPRRLRPVSADKPPWPLNTRGFTSLSSDLSPSTNRILTCVCAASPYWTLPVSTPTWCYRPGGGTQGIQVEGLRISTRLRRLSVCSRQGTEHVIDTQEVGYGAQLWHGRESLGESQCDNMSKYNFPQRSKDGGAMPGHTASSHKHLINKYPAKNSAATSRQRKRFNRTYNV